MWILWRALWRRPAWERELDEELRSHLELRAADLVRTGLPRPEAERRARLEFGAREHYKEECRSAHGLRAWDEIRQDLRYAARTLRRAPVFTAVAVFSLALGIGANSVVFSVVNALALKPLPVASPEDLYFIQANNYPAQSYPNYRELRGRNVALAGLIAARVAPMALETAGAAHRVWGYLASGNYFDVLGVRPALGRVFHADDERGPNSAPYAVLSYDCWRTRFAADPRIAGRTIRINTEPYTVLGVAPRGFHGTELFYWPEIWVPLMMQPQIEGHSWLEERNTFNCWVIGRLKPGVTVAQAEADLASLAAALAREYPTSNFGLKLKLAKPGLVGDALRAPAQAFWTGVLCLAVLVLLAACANLAVLLAARAADRLRELAIRLSLGAGRARLVRQFLTEALLLAVLGGAAAAALASVLLALLGRWRAPLDFPVQFDLTPDARVFAFTAAVSLLTGLLFGVAPARLACGTEPNQALRGLPGAFGRHGALRELLLAVQVALCCVLVTAAFISLRGLARALATPVGFRARGVAALSFDVGLARYSPDAGRNFQRRARDAVAGLPGIESAAFASSLPLSIDQSTSKVFPENATDYRLSKGQPASYYDVSPGYFRTVGTRLLSGRDFTWQDDARAPRVAVVNRTFARRVFGTRDAVGRRFRYGRNDPPVEVVGVVEDGKYVTLAEAARAALFRPAAQSYNGTTVLLARSALPEPLVASDMRQAVARLDPHLPAYAVGSLAEMLHFAFLPARAAAIALGAFGLLALMLAVTGIYGVAAYTVSRRVREIGIRVAVGASPSQVLCSVLGRTALLVGAGSLAGMTLGVAAGRVLDAVVYQASPRDPLVLAGVAFTLALVAVAAVYGPARCALSVGPLEALREM